MVKDRLNELQRLNNANEATIEMHNNNTQNELENTNEKLRYTFDRAKVTTQWISQIEDNNGEIRRLLDKVVDNLNHKDLDDKLNSLFNNNTTIARQTNEKIKEIGEELKNSQDGSTEQRIKNIQYNTTKKRYEDAFLQNNKLLERYKNVQKNIIKAQMLAKGYFKVTDEEVALLLEEGGDIQVFTDNILADTAEARKALALVEERHEKLLEIERMLTEVRDLFLQMSVLVNDQQELVDRIEYQANLATEAIGSAQSELKQGRKNKKKYLKRKIYLLIAIAVLITIILVLIFK